VMHMLVISVFELSCGEVAEEIKKMLIVNMVGDVAV
jgi:hypothetical protein